MISRRNEGFPVVATPDEQRLRRLVLQRLQSLRSAGVLDLPRPPHDPAMTTRVTAESHVAAAAANAVSQATLEPAQEEPVPSRRQSGPKQQSPDLFRSAMDDDSLGPPLSNQQRIAELAALCEEVKGCTLCHELATTRTQTVFGTGNPMARLAFLGEAPGADEDRKGEPFVGRAGQLLTKIIEACTLRRDDVYILNILKCRPPGNRNPSPDEAANCRQFLERQLRIIRPEFICCLGAVAAQNLLDTTTPIGRLRGKIHAFGGIKVVATYHPAYLLRNPSAKRATWDDMKFLMKEMGIEISGK